MTPTSSTPEHIIRLREFLDQEQGADRFSGTVMVETGGGVVFEGAYGHAHCGFGVANRLETRFNLASVTKMFTAVAALQLVEQGRLNVEDTLANHLPDLKLVGSDRITVHHLLSHTSGLGSFWNDECRRHRSTLRTIDAYLRLIQGMAPAFDPGTQVAYDNAGYLVLGAIIERASGCDYYEYVEQHVCRAAGMNEAEFVSLDEPNDVAHGYTHIEWDGPGHPDRRTDNIFQYPVRGNPAVGLYASAPEMLRFWSALSQGRLLGPEMVALMWQDQHLGGVPTGLGYGCQLIPYSAGVAIGHAGRVFGGATIFLDLPEVDHRVCILSNYDRPADKRVFAVIDDWFRS